MKITGTVETIREIEKTVELARTKGNVLIGKESKKKQPIQGKEWESAAFSRTYEVFLGDKVKNWEESSGAFFELLIAAPIKINFWYEYRDGDVRRGTGNVSIARKHLEVAYKVIPEFKAAFKRAIGLSNNGGVSNANQKSSSQG